jgi:hypothetical protein
MHERLLLAEHSLALLALFAAIGSGPAVGLIRDLRVRLVTMPMLGLALTASLLTSVAPFLTIGTATWTVLVPAAVLSLAVALALARRRRPATGRTREIAVPAAALLIGITLALLPPVSRGTQGPFALVIDDGWGYAATSLFLQHHRTGDRLPAETARSDLTMLYGAGHMGGGARIGVDTVNAAAATLLRTDVAVILSPLLAVLFGLVPALIWLVVRDLGGSWQAAALGAAFGFTPAILSMVEDSALANLAGVVLAAPVLLFLFRSARGSLADAVVAGVLLGGLVAVYPEFLAPVLLVSACGGLVFGIDRARRGALRESVRRGVTRIGLAAVTAIVIAPYAGYRALEYLSSRGSDGPWAVRLPVRAIDIENVGSWAFGVEHLYEMATFSALPPSRLAFGICFPVLLAGVVVFGAVKRFRRSGVFVVAAILVAVALGLYAYHSFQSGHCEYCLWKSLTFMIPFLAAGLALGFERLWFAAGIRRKVPLWRMSTAAVAVVAVVAIGYSDSRLVQLTRDHGAFCPCELRDLGPRLDRLPSRSPILIEGVGAMSEPFFMTPAVYFYTHGHKEPVLLDAGSPAWGVDYLGLTAESAPSYYSPDYTYVLTPFEDVRSNRTPLARYGPLLLERRAPIDVVVSPPGWAVDSTAPRIPWISTPFTLRVASSKAVDAAITLSLVRLAAGASTTLTFTSEQRQLGTVAASGDEVCVNVHLQKGSTSIEVTPVPDLPVDPKSPKLPKELGLAAIKAAPGLCRANP